MHKHYRIRFLIGFISFFLLSPAICAGEIALSESLGSIQDSYICEDSPYTVYFIKDAHCNYEAQENISKIISYLVNSRNIQLVAMEGAVGEIDPVDLRKFPYEETRRVVSNFFMRNGRINGAEYYAITDSNPVIVAGLEDRSLYCENYACLTQALRQGGCADLFGDIELQLDPVKKAVYSSEIMELELLELAYVSGDIPFQSYLEQLVALSKDSGVFGDSYRNLTLCLDLIKLEKELRLPLIEQERARLVRTITESMSQARVNDFLQENLKFRLNKISYQAYLENIFEIAKEYSIDTTSYEQLTNYKRYLNLHSSIRQDAIFAEADSLAQSIFDSLCRNEEQRNVRRIGKQVQLLKKAFKLDISSSEWTVLTKNPVFFKSETDMRLLGSYNSSFLSVDYLAQLEAYFPVIEQFYLLAQQRDEVLVRNLLGRLDNDDFSSAIIVAGGYHASGITAKLQERKISYYVISARITNVDESNPYASIVLNADNKWSDLFSRNRDSLALSSWLESNPLIEPQNNFIFGNMFKSLLLSTLAWQLTGYDLVSVKELNMPILRGVQEKLNEVARMAEYDIRVIELARVDDQVYVRMSVAGAEVVYGLFAQSQLVDWVKVRSDRLTEQTVLSEFQLLGGSVLVLTPEQYEGILMAKGRSVLAEESSSEGMVRTLLANPLSEHIIQVYGLLDIDGKTRDVIPEVSSRITNLLKDTVGIIEDNRAVEEYLRSYIDENIARGRMAVDPQTQTIRLGSALKMAALTAQQMHNHPDGRLVQIGGAERSVAVRQGAIQFIFGSSTIPLEVSTRFWLKIEEMTESTQLTATQLGKLLSEQGPIDLGVYGNEHYLADITSFSLQETHGSNVPAYCAVIRHQTRMPVLPQIGDIYTQILGEDAISINPQDKIALSIRSLTSSKKSISLIKVIDLENVAVSPEFGINLEELSTLDEAIKRLKNWMDLNQIRIQTAITTVDSIPGPVRNLLFSVFSSVLTDANEYDQLDEFRKLLSAFNFAAKNQMTETMAIISGKVIDIIQGRNPRLRVIKQILSGEREIQGLAFTKAEQKLIYHIYLYSIQYNQENIDLTAVDPLILSRLLQDVYMEETPVTPDSVHERLLKELRGGKYNIKLDLSAISQDAFIEDVQSIFSDTSAMDTAFGKAGIAFENISKIRVYKSRFRGFVSDYRVLVELYDNTRKTVRLRVLNNPVLENSFGWQVIAMERINDREDKVFPTVYLYKKDQYTNKRYYIAEHIEGMIGDRLSASSSQFTPEEITVYKTKGIRTWMTFWKQSLVPKDPSDKYVIERAAIISPTIIDGLIFPDDGSEPKILGIGYSLQPDPMTFYELLLNLSNGFGLKSEEYATVLANSIIDVFGFDRAYDLLVQALSESDDSKTLPFDKEYVTHSNVFQMIHYIRVVSALMKRDTVKKYIDIMYNGDVHAGFVDIADRALATGKDPLVVLRGKFSEWDRRMPSSGEVKQKLRRQRPSILTVTGGTGGNSLINAIKDIGGTSMVNLVTTFDTGGQSYLWQDIFDPLVGYSYSKGDVTNVAVAYIDQAKQDLLNKRLPADRDIDAIYPIVHELIKPTLERYPQLKDDPMFLIDFMDAVKKIDELIDYLRQKNRDDPARYRKPDLRKASLKNLLIEALNFYSNAYNLDEGRFDIDQAMVAEDLLHRLLGIDNGLVIPLSTEEGDLVARLHTPMPADKIASIENEIKIDTGIQRNRISPDGSVVFGEHYIGEIGEFHEEFGKQIDYIDIVTHPDHQGSKPQMSSRALEALQYQNLDLILVGPGSLYTSLLPHFTIGDFVENLINRGKAQTIVYPNGQRVQVEPVKRVFIINPVYSFEDKDMSVSDIIRQIERTAQNAVGNPKLRFADMFDAVVVNDPSNSSQQVKDYIRKKNMDVIIPLQEDIDFLESQGIEVYSFDLATVQSRPTRTPGFDLQYEDKLEYSAEKLRLITNLFLDSTRHHKKESRRNVGLGMGFQATGEFDRVKKILHGAEITPIPRGDVFHRQGLNWLEMRAKQLSNKIGRESEESTRILLERDLSLLHRVIDSIKSNTMKMFSAQPQNGSQGIFVDDGMHYQFAVAIPVDERGLNHGMYFSAGLVSLVQRYFEQARIAESISKYEISDSYMNKVGSIAAEAMFHLYALWELSESQGDKFDFIMTQSELQRINKVHIGLPNPMYGTILYDELAKMASKEAVEANLEESVRMAGIPEDISVTEKLKMVSQMIEQARKAERIRNSLLKLSSELADKFEARLTTIATDERFSGILLSGKVQDFLAKNGIDSIDLMTVDYGEHLRKIAVMLEGDVSLLEISDWFSQLPVIQDLLDLLLIEVEGSIDTIAPNDFEGLDKLAMGLIDMKQIYQAIDGNINAIEQNNYIVDSMNLLSKISIFQLDEIHRELTIQRDMQPRYDATHYGDLPADILEKRDILETLFDGELVVWMDQHIIARMTDNPAIIVSNFEQMVAIMETMLESFPHLRDAYATANIPDTFTDDERVVVETLMELSKLKNRMNLQAYSGIRHFLHDISLIPLRGALLPALGKIINPDDKKSVNFIIAARHLFVDLSDRMKYLEQAIESVRFDFPRAFSRFEYILHRQRLLPDRNIGLGDGHHGENPARVNDIIAVSNVERIALNNPLLKGVTNHIRRVALDLMVASKDHDEQEKQKMHGAALLFTRVHGLLETGQYRIWSVDPQDGNPGLYIDDKYAYQFAAIRDQDIYFAKGLLDRMKYLWDQGQHHLVIGMLAESIVHEIGENLFEAELGDQFEQVAAHQAMKEYAFYLGEVAPVVDLDAEPETMLYREMHLIAARYVESRMTNMQEAPQFVYPSDIPSLRSRLQEGILKGSLTPEHFLDIIAGHFRFGVSLGAPSELMYNNAYYHPGEVLGFVREFTLPEIRGASALNTYESAIDTMIMLSKTDDFSKQKAKEILAILLTDKKYADFIGRFSPHALEDMMYDVIRIITGDNDPYQQLKDEYNHKALDSLDEMDAMISNQQEPLLASALVAIAGNALDFAHMETFGEISEKGFSFVDEIGRILQPDTNLVRNDYAYLIERLNAKPNQRIVYAIDNAGEIITDLPFLKRLLQMGHSIVLVTRDKHTVNDISYEDALRLFGREDIRNYFTDYAENSLLEHGAFEIIHSGSNVTGTDLRRATRKFVDVWQQADLRLLKGQGNYETLRYYPMKHDMFFLVKVKDPLATARNYEKGDILIEYRALNPLIGAYQTGNIDQVIQNFRNDLTDHELSLATEFLVFYLDHLSTQADLLTADGNTQSIRELLDQARVILDRAVSIPAINAELLGIIQRKIRNESLISDFLFEYVSVHTGLVSVPQVYQEQFVVIDFSAIPETDLSYVYELISSLESQRSPSEVSVRWVIFSADHSVREMMEELLRRKFYRPGMDIIGKDTLDSVEADGKIRKIELVISSYLTSRSIESSALKILTADDLDAAYCALNNMMVLKIDPRGSMLQMSDFIAALISIDSFIHGGKIPNLIVESPKTGSIHNISDMLSLRGGVSSANLMGSVLRLQPSQPVKQNLQRIEHRRALENSI
ncbi:MAG: ARMT1-like domain-containing protein [Candidatus Auribacterota bacterium]|jgi:uncharacterized protein with ATP-grasp and redox domains/2-phospho-L-lactate transferase/gluconeogenesis factor (CofD/UPF0052 family)|nr:ARMT1-like domain-containing protein [Candidatus Auribacterota bacterium]